MPDLLLRNLPDGLKREIASRARAQGHSLSREARLLIQRGLAAEKVAAAQKPDTPGMGTLLSNLLPPDCRIDDAFLPARDEADRAPPDFGSPAG